MFVNGGGGRIRGNLTRIIGGFSHLSREVDALCDIRSRRVMPPFLLGRRSRN